jgi:hypothetical protein
MKRRQEIMNQYTKNEDGDEDQIEEAYEENRATITIDHKQIENRI